MKKARSEQPLKSRLTPLILIVFITACGEPADVQKSSMELYQDCIKQIDIADPILLKARTLACRLELSTLSEIYIPLNSRRVTSATLIDKGASIAVKGVKNDSKTKVVAEIELWVALPTSETSKCDDLPHARAHTGAEGCSTTFGSTDVWLAPGEATDIQVDIGEKAFEGNRTWSWGFQSYRYFELSPSAIDQKYDRILRVEGSGA